MQWEFLGNPRFPLKGSFKGDVDIGIDVGVGMDTDSDGADTSSNWG